MKRLTTMIACAALAALALAPAARADFGIEPGSFTAGSYAGEGTGKYAPLADGAIEDPRAGDHPFQSATAFAFTTHTLPNGFFPDGAVKDVVLDLPPGFVGNPTVTPHCQQSVLLEQGFCPNDTAVGLAYVPVDAIPFLSPEFETPGRIEPGQFFSLPVYNMQPSFGEPALLGLYATNPSFVTLIHFHLRSADDYSIAATASDISNIAAIYSNRIAIWGTPAAASHDQWRGYGNALPGGGSAAGPGCVAGYTAGPGQDLGPQFSPSAATPLPCSSDAQPARPFLTNPSSCDGKPVTTTIHVDSWQEPGALDSEGEPDLSDSRWKSDVAEAQPVEGCANLKFGGAEAPVTFTDEPDNTSADSPAAHALTLTLPYNEEPGGLANPPLRDTTVRFPEDVTLNSAAASGLAACTSAQIGLTTATGETPARFDGAAPECPQASRLGTVEVETPLIEHTLKGTLYQAKQFDNPFGSLLAVYLVIEDPETGTIVKLPGELVADKATGDLTTTFTDSPQLPFTHLTVRTKGGPSAPLVNSRTCGTKTTSGEFTPWSAPQSGSPAQTTSSVTLAEGAGGACPNSLANRPFATGFEAGVAEPSANAESPFSLRLTRPEGNQEFDRVEVTTPPGFAATLANVPYCPQSGIEQAEARNKAGDGALEEAGPSCPAASQVGTTTIGVGAGPNPYYVSGKAYLAGPYKGAPLSLVFVVPAVAGPFDLGVQVVRTALDLNSESGQITAKSDSIPQMLEGIPLRIRDIRVSVDRPNFALNPTNCDVFAVTGTAYGSNGASSPLSDRFQVGGCSGLGFKPKLSTRLSGGTRRGKWPKLKATLKTRPGDANVGKRVVVTLPHSEFLAQEHIKTICTRVQFAADECPAASIYGHAKAVTPLLGYPLEGPVYLRSNGGERLLPDLVVALKGPEQQPIEIDLAGYISSHDKGIRTIFEAVPDERISSFTLEMDGGKRGLLVNSRNLCSAPSRVSAEIDGQNGKTADQRPLLQAGCHQKKGAKGKRHAAHSNKRAFLARLLEAW